MQKTIRAFGLVCIISVSSLATSSAIARGGHFGGHHGGHRGSSWAGGFVLGAVLAPLVVSSILYPPVYYGPTYYPPAYYPPAYHPPVYNTYPQQTYPLQGVPSNVAPVAGNYTLQQTPAVGPPVPPPGSAPNYTGAGQSGASWYYCAESSNYYPYVRECASLWRPEPVRVQQ
jgi:hypothetical protein